MTSHFEGEPLALLEAAAYELLILGRDTPGLGRAINKVGGFLVSQSASPEEFGNLIRSKLETQSKNIVPVTSWITKHDVRESCHKYCELLDV